MSSLNSDPFQYFWMFGILVAGVALMIILSAIVQIFKGGARTNRRRRTDDSSFPDPMMNPANPLSPLYRNDQAPGASAPDAGDTSSHHGSHHHPSTPDTWTAGGGGFDSGSSSGGGGFDSGGGGHSHH